MPAINLDLDLDLPPEEKKPAPAPVAQPQPVVVNKEPAQQVAPAPVKKQEIGKSEVVLTTSDERKKSKEATNSRLIAKQRYIPSKIGLILSIVAVVLSLAGICTGLFLFLKK